MPFQFMTEMKRVEFGNFCGRYLIEKDMREKKRKESFKIVRFLFASCPSESQSGAKVQINSMYSTVMCIWENG